MKTNLKTYPFEFYWNKEGTDLVQKWKQEFEADLRAQLKNVCEDCDVACGWLEETTVKCKCFEILKEILGE